MEGVKEYLARIGRRGGKARLTKMTAEERKKVARNAAKARWAKFDETLDKIEQRGKETNTQLKALERKARARLAKQKKEKA